MFDDDDDSRHREQDVDIMISPRAEIEDANASNREAIDGGRVRGDHIFFPVSSTTENKSRPGLLRGSGKNNRKFENDNLEMQGGNEDHEKVGRTKLLSATSAALTRFKGMTIRSGNSGKVLTPRSVTMFAGTRNIDYKGNRKASHSWSQSRPDTSKKSEKIDIKRGDDLSPEPLVLEVPVPMEGKETASKADQVVVAGKLTTMFDDSDDDDSGGAGDDLDEDDEEYAASPRSNWASTLAASTLARAKAARKTPTVGGQTNLLPHPRDSGNKVDYLVMVCKAAETYASSQTAKLTRVRDGQHMINQLLDVATDLGRQRDKILAVYDAREVQRSADRLGETLKGVYDVVGDLEVTAVMFGKKRGFGKRVTALVHDIGTNANALLAATSLAIADRPNVLYMADTGAGEPPAPQQEELVKMCIEGDKFFFGRGEKPNLRRAYEAYAWAAERGCAEAMYMSAWMYRAGAHVESDVEKCQLWLERAVEKGYAPAMNDLAVILLQEADQLEAVHPEVKAGDPEPVEFGTAGGDSGGGSRGERFVRTFDYQDEKKDHGKIQEGSLSSRGNMGRMNDRDQGSASVVCVDEDNTAGFDTSGSGDSEASLPPEQAQMFERVMTRRRRAMTLLQDAAKTGHTDSMTNLGNMQEAMGYLDEARTWYSLAAEPSESANNARAQNYLGTLYYEGRGVAKDLPEAVKWFQRGARQGNAQACQNLGTCYQAGLGVAKDTSKAVELFRQAVEGGSIPATNNLAYLLARDALHSLATAARQAPAGVGGSGKGLKFEDPSKGLMQSDETSTEASNQVWRETTAQLREAADLFRRAADNGVTDASYQLGRLYQQGLGIPRDPVAAFGNFLAAADSAVPHPTAAACVGDMLYAGTGCLRDFSEAMRYYLVAAKAGEPASANAVGLMLELGRGVERDLSAAGEWYARAAEQGSADGAFNAALLLERGDLLSAFASIPGPFPSGIGYANASPGASSSVRTSHLPPPRPQSRSLSPKRAARRESMRETGGDNIDCDEHRSWCSSSNDDGDDREEQGDENLEDLETANRERQSQHHRYQGEQLDDPVTGDKRNNEYSRRRQERRQRRRGRRRSRPRQCRQSPLPLPPPVWGDRKAALRMFERAVELGHPGAETEVHRLRLRDRMDAAVSKDSASADTVATGRRGRSIGAREVDGSGNVGAHRSVAASPKQT